MAFGTDPAAFGLIVVAKCHDRGCENEFMSLDKLPINLFDLVLLVVLGTSLYRGRRAGMSGELISLLTWLSILFGCAIAYEPAGQFLAQNTGLFSMLGSYVIAYVGAGIVILLLFASLKRGLAGRLHGLEQFRRYMP